MADVMVVEQQPEPDEVAEPVAPAVTEAAAETIAEAAVAVAETEAERDIAIAEIQADIAREGMETAREVVREDDAEWRSNLEARMAAQEASQSETLSILQQLSERLPPNPSESQENPAAMPDSQEPPEPPAKPKPVHHRLI